MLPVVFSTFTVELLVPLTVTVVPLLKVTLVNPVSEDFPRVTKTL
jgi:hypothetical protein